MTRKQWWLVLGIETLALTALVLWILSSLDRLAEPSALLVGLIIVAAGDLATALVLQRLAPTIITLEPGERRAPLARTLTALDERDGGIVRLRGERWRARLAAPGNIRAGTAVRIVSRDGLTLLVEPVVAESDRGSPPATE